MLCPNCRGCAGAAKLPPKPTTRGAEEARVGADPPQGVCTALVPAGDTPRTCWTFPNCCPATGPDGARCDPLCGTGTGGVDACTPTCCGTRIGTAAVADTDSACCRCKPPGPGMRGDRGESAVWGPAEGCLMPALPGWTAFCMAAKPGTPVGTAALPDCAAICCPLVEPSAPPAAGIAPDRPPCRVARERGTYWLLLAGNERRIGCADGTARLWPGALTIGGAFATLPAVPGRFTPESLRCSGFAETDRLLRGAAPPADASPADEAAWAMPAGVVEPTAAGSCWEGRAPLGPRQDENDWTCCGLWCTLVREALSLRCCASPAVGPAECGLGAARGCPVGSTHAPGTCPAIRCWGCPGNDFRDESGGSTCDPGWGTCGC
mmetsp:Transcript_85532/g.245644  ORF Transcript_85532/g.245644 Transcript_85532/m.245644 type:complete len:378 (-) Transcript_85532:35-1168(-)